MSAQIASFATSTAPWWGVPVVAGGFAILGGVVAWFSSMATKGRELRRADQARWDNEILDSAVKLIGHTNAIAAVNNKANTFSYKEKLADRLLIGLAEYLEMKPLIDRLDLIASDRLVAVAATMLEAAAAGTNQEVSTFDQQALSDATANFTDAVRREIRANK